MSGIMNERKLSNARTIKKEEKNNGKSYEFGIMFERALSLFISIKLRWNGGLIFIVFSYAVAISILAQRNRNSAHEIGSEHIPFNEHRKKVRNKTYTGK